MDNEYVKNSFGQIWQVQGDAVMQSGPRVLVDNKWEPGDRLFLLASGPFEKVNM